MPLPLASAEMFGGILGFLLLTSPVWLLIGGGLIGRHLERRHFADIEQRERETSDVILTDLKAPPPGFPAAGGEVVTGSVVIAADYFKSFASALKTLIGGNMISLERMQERARREAILRMVDEARARGARAITNVRVETSTIAGKRSGSCAGVEVLASGTALVG